VRTGNSHLKTQLPCQLSPEQDDAELRCWLQGVHTINAETTDGDEYLQPLLTVSVQHEEA